MNGIARFVWGAIGAQCALGATMASTASLDEYLYPVAVPPTMDARLAYHVFPSGIYEQGSGNLQTRIYDRTRYSVVAPVVLGERKDESILGTSSLYFEESRKATFVNDVNHSGSPLLRNYDCFFPKIPLLDVKPQTYPHIVTLDVSFECLLLPLLSPQPRYTFTARYGAPTVLTVEDGNLIEAVRVVVERDGYAWGDYLFGYHLGLIRFDAAEKTKTFFSVPQLAVTSLPPPAVEGTVVEYRNTQNFPQSPGGHFFYSSDPAEQASVDAGQAGKFERTGRSFNAGGYLPVCRFYGSVTPGPNSHFFSAMPEECALLKSLQRTYIAPSTEPQWNSEGNGFYTVAPLTDAQGQKRCLSGTQPVYRAYNNAFPANGPRNSWDSNHRFSTQRSDIDDMVQRYGWRDEGIVFCTPLEPAA